VSVEGTPFGRYRLIELLGRGGMGEVWRAYDTAIGRVVALKVLPAHLANDQTFDQRFRREARAAASLDEPHIVPIHDFGEIDGRLYVTMRLIEGRDMQAVLTHGPLEPARAVSIIEQVASALHAAHRIGLVHRDVKPSNILVAEDDFAYLIDFGIARTIGEAGLTGTGNVIGTWAYLAPERLSHGHIEPRADIYALTCVLHECLTGSQPFPANSLEQTIAAHMSMPPPRPSALRNDLPAQLDSVIATGMAKDPGQRYATTRELAKAARAAITDPVPFGRGGAPYGAPVGVPYGGHPVQPYQPIPGGPPPNAPTQFGPPPGPHGPMPPGPVPPYLPPTGPVGNRRYRSIAIAAVLAVVTVIAIVVGVVLATGGEDSKSASTHPTSTEPGNSGSFTGVYRVDLGPETSATGKALDSSTRTGTFQIRSTCRKTGCVATALVKDAPVLQQTMVFDEVGASWLAVGISNETPQTPSGLRKNCKEGQLQEIWEAITLQPKPDGTLSGQYTATNQHLCSTTRPVTFTRTGDVELNGLPDPANQPARVSSPAEGLRGRYHRTVTWPDNRPPNNDDFEVKTDCLRAGDRCMSYFHGPKGADPLLFADGKWTESANNDYDCTPTVRAHNVSHSEFSLPQQPQNPITLLTGHGHSDVAPGTTCSGSLDFQTKYDRTGD
jgi:hypothetical protein